MLCSVVLFLPVLSQKLFRLFGMGSKVQLRLGDWVSVYEGSASGDFAEWVTKFEVVCRLQKYKDLESIIPLVLKGPAFAVYMQLSAVDKNDYESIKGALTKAFCIGSVQAYELFRQRSLQPGEAIDVFVADLRRLYGLLNAGPCPDAVLKCAVIPGLTDGTK